MSEGEDVEVQNDRCFVTFTASCLHVTIYICITNAFAINFFSSDSELDYEKDEEEEEDDEEDEDEDEEEQEEEHEREDIQDRFYTYLYLLISFNTFAIILYVAFVIN
jgi:hypothetical protein